ncbi:MAG: T9SS type A sorting domain-containing protein [FCB group bacterium]|nr:T9SS type A sorting domain-containing protein [FCB group bacterium]
MRKSIFMPLLILLLLVSFQAVLAADCVDVSIELPATVTVGTTSSGYFELTNCGDDAQFINLSFDITFNDIPFSVGAIPIWVGAGETVSREFRFPVPPPLAGNSVTFCVTATAGTAEANDCATVTIEGSSTDSQSGNKNFTLSLASADNCVDVDLELPDTVVAGPASFADGYFELTNCGDEADTTWLEVGLNLFDTTINIGNIPVMLGAGETISRNFHFPVPPIVPAGEYGICIYATSGDAMASACQTVVVVSDFGLPTNSKANLQNYPNPFNPNTTISFDLSNSSHVNLTIYNILGQPVRTLLNKEMTAGSYNIEWNGKDDNGQGLSSGIYFYKLQAGSLTATKKMLMLK